MKFNNINEIYKVYDLEMFDKNMIKDELKKIISDKVIINSIYENEIPSSSFPISLNSTTKIYKNIKGNIYYIGYAHTIMDASDYKIRELYVDVSIYKNIRQYHLYNKHHFLNCNHDIDSMRISVLYGR